jgi:hypothetical protein
MMFILLFAGDALMQSHEIFNQYSDYCMAGPGKDKSWTIGTEHRQLAIYEAELKSPRNMKNMMVDNLKRRFFILDACVKVSKFVVDATRRYSTLLDATQR